ncbi:probable ATP-dependent RNA helicase DDX46, partial [Leptonychotes weddellii]|uniref:Probable ATP-dependent RNA helicase DDX46 n=1 Tax=Leptonychotes weddellii TaxID=9713 RepID=A0A7F8QJV9_LEPWE
FPSVSLIFPKNFDQNKLEEEMRKRKERVEKWREEQRKKAMENIGELKKEIEEMKQGKKWSLEDDDDDEDDPAEAEKEGNEMEGEELDPLDAYMEEVKEEVKKFNMRSVKGGGGNEKKSGPTVTKVVTVVTTKKAVVDSDKKKGELMENDQDAMEVVMRIVDNVRPDRQTVMFSATFPRAMEALARRILSKPIEVQVGGRSVVCSDVEQQVIVIEEEKKFLKLLELLGHYQESGSVIIFVDKQEHADGLLKDLMRASYPCMSLHGGIDQYDRDSIINDFKNGTCKLLVATSVAARGLDVKHLILVVNYSCPNHYEDYVHRAGRTGRAGNKGYAYTFITEDQARYAGDIIKALELSGTAVPPDLEKLWSDFKDQQKAEGKIIKKSSGFSGKGFKFDETEQALANERKKLQKAALGLQDSDDEDAAVDIDEQIESMFNSKKRVKDMAAPGTSSVPAPTAGNAEKLEIAKRLALRINAQKNLGIESQDVMQQATNAILRGGTILAPTVSAKTIAEQLAEKINAKLNYVPLEKQEEERQDGGQNESFKRYEEELEINDFPQTARWKVTSKEALQRISEYSEAAITIRGTYFPPGKEPKEGERKIYLAIESANELAVQKAKAEITRLIKEELIRLQNSYQPTNKGRYKVL